MTRAEQKKLKEKKENDFIESIKGKKIDGKIKEKYRLTSIWKTFRKFMSSKYKIDFLTHRKLQKKFNLHHVRFSPELYTDLDEKYFRCYNPNTHDILHWLVSETIKDPTFMKRITEEVEFHIKVNDGKDVKDFLKD